MKNAVIKIIVSTILILYVIILSTAIIGRDIENHIYDYLKFFTILLCFLLTVFTDSNDYSKSDSLHLQLALFFTVSADFFMLISNYPKTGVLVFIFVQATHIIRHSKDINSACKAISYIMIICITATAIMLALFTSQTKSSMHILVMCYAILLLLSLFTAFIATKSSYYPKEKTIMTAIGMLLFCLCDINVGLFNITQNNRFVSNGIPFNFLVWFFYIPSQLLLSLSAFKFEYLKNIFFIPWIHNRQKNKI